MSDRGRNLEAVLESLPYAVAWPPESPDLASRVVARLPAKMPRLQLRRWAPAVAVALAVVVLAWPGARQVVADVLTEAGVRIGFVMETPSAGGGLALGSPVSLEDAEERVPFPLRVPIGELGPPDSVFADGAGVVSMVWEGGARLPAVAGTGVAVLFTQGIAQGDFAYKGLGEETEVAHTEVEGEIGVWIEGAEHSFVLLDSEGNPVGMTTRLAANVLLWEANGVNHRLELTGSLEEALAIVKTLEVR